MTKDLNELRERLKEYGCELRPSYGGYLVYQDGTVLRFCPDLAAVEALFLTDKEVDEAASRIAKDLLKEKK